MLTSLLKNPADKTIRWVIKPLVFILSLLPFCFILFRLFNDDYANPVESMIRETGEWVLIFLLITLSVTPLRQWLKRAWLLKLRRMLGLFSFFYVVLHFLIYLLLDRQLNMPEIVQDLTERPYIIVGFLAFLFLIPLAFTSTNKMMRRLGQQWKKLHKLIYIIVPLGILHFFWLIKADLSEPIMYSVIFIVLMLSRIKLSFLDKKSK